MPSCTEMSNFCGFLSYIERLLDVLLLKTRCLYDNILKVTNK